MKINLRNLGIIATMGYFLGILLIAYILITLPQDLKNIATGINLNFLKQIDPVLVQLNISIATVLGLGTASLIFLLFDNKTGSVEKVHTTSKSRSETGDLTSVETEEVNEDIIKKVQALASTNEDVKGLSSKVLSEICKEVEACQGAVYITHIDGSKRQVELFSSFAYPVADSERVVFEFGEGLVGQAAKEGRILNIDSVPEGYINILSGLGSSSPTNLIIIPIIHQEKVCGVVEISSFKKFTSRDEKLLNDSFAHLAPKLSGSKESLGKKKATVTQ